MEAPAPSAPPTFEELMLPHMDAAYNLARWLLRDPHDAEDALQDACLRAYRSMDRFRGGDGRAWLLTIVRNVCYSRLRQRRREPAKDAFDEDAHGSTHDPADANAVAWREAKGEMLQQALERLPDEYREVIVLHELTITEVVEIVDLMIQRVSNQLELQGLSLALTPEAKTLLADKGYDPQLGARPLRRAIQQMVEDPLSERILWKEFRVGETIVVDVETITPEAADAYDVKGAPPLIAGEQQLTFTAIEGIEPPPPVELAGADSSAD